MDKNLYHLVTYYFMENKQVFVSHAHTKSTTITGSLVGFLSREIKEGQNTLLSPPALVYLHEERGQLNAKYYYHPLSEIKV